jgi:hypothetical protein
MKNGYNYGILKFNNPNFAKESTYLDNKYKKTKYALIEKQVFKDGSEGINRIIYSNDFEKLTTILNIYPSWYNYPQEQRKNLQGYVSKFY